MCRKRYLANVNNIYMFSENPKMSELYNVWRLGGILEDLVSQVKWPIYLLFNVLDFQAMCLKNILVNVND